MACWSRWQANDHWNCATLWRHIFPREQAAAWGSCDCLAAGIERVRTFDTHNVAEHQSPLLLSDILPIWENTCQREGGGIGALRHSTLADYFKSWNKKNKSKSIKSIKRFTNNRGASTRRVLFSTLGYIITARERQTVLNRDLEGWGKVADRYIICDILHSHIYIPT